MTVYLVRGVKHRSALSLIAVLFLLQILFPLTAAAQTKELTIVVECIEFIGNGKINATFGYDNPGKDLTVARDKSFLLTGSTRSDAITTFRKGRQYNVFAK